MPRAWVVEMRTNSAPFMFLVSRQETLCPGAIKFPQTLVISSYLFQTILNEFKISTIAASPGASKDFGHTHS